MTIRGRAALCVAHGEPLTVENIDTRRPGPGEVIVDMDAAAVCITDIMSLGGMTFAPPPYIPGHSGSGVVSAVGPGVRHVNVGDRVAATGTAECGLCYACLRGTPSACEDIGAGMFTPFHVATRSDGNAVTADLGCGVFAERMLLRESVLAVYDADITPVQAATLGCGIVSGLGAVFNVARVVPGATVAVVGCGHLGLWIIQAATLAGAERIIAVEPDEHRRSLATAVGATHVVGPGAGDPVAQVKDLTGGRGVDYALEAGGTVEGTVQAYEMTRGAGVLVTTSMARPEDRVTFGALDIGVSAKEIRSSQSGGGRIKRDVPRYARLLERGVISTEHIITQVFKLDEVNAAIEAAEQRKVITGVVTF
ncbi:zinc-binding dehydrogenase [Streptomyces sp. NPDC020951]|uniref:zinc-binding dehydrogenase n=1 Tax=Streptomyces sp. NPDC020951 TaxID=3365104 RepID=UPI0037A87BFE